MNNMFGNFFNNLGGMAQSAIGSMKQMGQMATEAEQIMQLIRLYKSGGNPMQMLAEMAQGNPQMAQALHMIEGKSPAQLQKMVQNMADTQGIDLNALAAQYNLK